MKELESGIKRLAIFVVYDKDGIVDDYIPYYLNDLSENVSHFVIACNGKLSDAGRLKLARFTDDILVRSNTGFDAGAYKDVLLNYLGWDKVLEFDELLLCNDTMFGPLFPFRRVFDEMDRRDADFWGLVEGIKAKYQKTSTYFPKHIQSFFINFKAQVLKSDLFRQFWTELPEPETHTQAVYTFEFNLSNLLSNNNFKLDVYSDSGLYSEAESYHTVYFDPYLSSSYFSCPLIKKGAFLINGPKKDWEFHGGETYNKLIDYIKRDTDYDLGLIWENILRLYDINRIKDVLRLNYVLSDEYTTFCGSIAESAVVVIRINAYSDYYMSVLSGFSTGLKLIILAGNKEIYTKLAEKLDTSVIQLIQCENAKNMRIVLPHIEEYKYLCSIELAERQTHRELITDFNLVWENALKNNTYIKNVLACFEGNPQLGYLALPQAYHGTRFSGLNNAGGKDLPDLKVTAERYGLRHLLKNDFALFPVSDGFWCRICAIEPFLKSISCSEPRNIIKQLLPYAAQRAGFYSGVVMSGGYSATRNVDFENVIAGILQKLSGDAELNSHDDLLDAINRLNALSFSLKYPDVYIYGAGIYAERCATFLERHNISFSGFIVSDGHRKSETYLGHKVFCVSELPPKRDEYGIIIGLGVEYTNEVYPQLVESGFTNLLKLNS